MLPIKRRLKKEPFTQVMKKGLFEHSSSLYLKYLRSQRENPSLFAFVVPVKVEKTSVGRHLSKRRVTSVVEKLLSQIKPGFLGIIFLKKNIAHLSYLELEDEIRNLLIKLKMLNEKAF